MNTAITIYCLIFVLYCRINSFQISKSIRWGYQIEFVFVFCFFKYIYKNAEYIYICLYTSWWSEVRNQLGIHLSTRKFHNAILKSFSLLVASWFHWPMLNMQYFISLMFRKYYQNYNLTSSSTYLTIIFHLTKPCFSSPELKACEFSDQLSSGVCPSIRLSISL